MSKRVEVLNCPMDTLSMEETLDLIQNSIDSKSRIHHVVVNAAKIVHLQKNKELYNSIFNCDIINIDGQAVVWAARFLGINVPERVTGVDLMSNLIHLANKKNYKVFFLGAKEEVLKKVLQKVEEKFGKNIIAGSRNGYFSPEEEKEVAKEIANSKADILFVAITSPKKENFLNYYKNSINTPFIMGVGGSFDVYSGLVNRAPSWMQSSGLEWFYRFLQEPRRMWRRYLITNSKFLLLMIKAKFKQVFK